MTDANYTAMLIILDRSGSMGMIREDMIGGLQQLITVQSSEPGMLTIDIVTFDTEIELTHHFADPATVKVELIPRGGTALYDAVGWSFNEFGQALAELPEHARPGTVLVTIVTDGEEHSSREYTASMVAKMIEHQRTHLTGMCRSWGLTRTRSRRPARSESTQRMPSTTTLEQSEPR